LTQLAAFGAVLAYLIALTIAVQATLRQHVSTGQRRPANQVTVVILLRILAVSFAVAAIVAGLLHQPLSGAIWLGLVVVTTGAGELAWRLRWPPARGAGRG